jgi:hypothetical protein
MRGIKALGFVLSARIALASCGYSAQETVKTTSYTPPETTVTTSTTAALYAAPLPEHTLEIVSTVTTNPDSTVRRTTTRYYYPRATYTYSSVNDATIASEVRSSIREDELLNAHARNIGIGSDAGVV